jgi:putative tryptophan/tyrosine transport system substrate-binding protein
MRDDSHHELVLRAEVAAFALKHRLPTIYGSTAAFAESGGLGVYGPNDLEYYRHAASYVDKILKGPKPGDLPIDQPTTFEVAVNLKTAKASASGFRNPPVSSRSGDRVIALPSAPGGSGHRVMDRRAFPTTKPR